MSPSQDELDSRAARTISFSIVTVAVIIMIFAFLMSGPVTSSRLPVAQTPPAKNSATALTLDGLHLLKSAPVYSLDVIQVSSGRQDVVPSQTMSVEKIARGQSLTLVGWAIDEAALAPARAILLNIDGKSLILATYGAERDDVGQHFGKSTLSPTGFRAVIPPGALSPGRHAIDIDIVNQDGSGYYRVSHRVIVNQSA